MSPVGKGSISKLSSGLCRGCHQTLSCSPGCGGAAEKEDVFGDNTAEEVTILKNTEAKISCQLENLLGQTSIFLYFTTKTTVLIKLNAVLKFHQETLTVIINGTVLIISRMNEMRKICSQMFP